MDSREVLARIADVAEKMLDFTKREQRIAENFRKSGDQARAEAFNDRAARSRSTWVELMILLDDISSLED